MAVKNVTRSGANAAPGSVIAALVEVVTELSTAFNTLTAKLDAEDVTNMDTDYASTCGTMDTIAFFE